MRIFWKGCLFAKASFRLFSQVYLYDPMTDIVYEYTLHYYSHWVLGSAAVRVRVGQYHIISYLHLQYHMSFHVIISKISCDIGNIPTPDIRYQA